MPALAHEGKQLEPSDIRYMPTAPTSPLTSGPNITLPSNTTTTVQGDAHPDTDDTDPVIPVSRAQLLACAFTSWWPLMRRHTMASRVVPLPDEFVAYLQEDGMQLPDKLAPARAERDAQDDSDSEWSEEEEEGEEENDSETAGEADSTAFSPSLIAAIDRAIDELGGCVHPRLDWRSPSDASWITCDKTTRCHSAADVVLLLKASTTIAQELANPFHHTTTTSPPPAAPPAPHRPSLVLRRWSSLYPSSRFRCFVYGARLLAVSQHDANHYAHLAQPAHRARTVAAIRRFVHGPAAQLAVQGEGRVLDVYVDGEERVWLVDVKPWSTRTDPALFSWHELLDLAAEEDEAGEESGGEDGDAEDDDECEYRVVESGGDNTYMLRIARRSLQRLPNVDGLDLSDAAGIERFAAAMDKLQ